ncbi:pyridoxal phosphate-dependent aminotransferase [Flammeovirga kamogawensis]|uniref:alanine transaminase n=1 Tax=Flammeovirga kamogawensis TaxID=373891 RepID=A0ABX8GZB2_9BACT|nr:pyridoxal phosphate-dependent aminotransferase [Flammeovirga kamogawensis]MBB6459109.1 aspartate/methionine/tyrosine aminotransferase [Flammeovirga kamogawensis]QWG08678.1 pyridoxal phosphate-dependent aminotransferase [Flammeovirga kamogawensis]TRX66971.1 pyridoxal phosphate-dependent aminotransferase [Flammeovirga kamogawensis]
MRQKLLRDGANELSYEIRGIVKKADKLKTLGQKIYWENIGDPIQKNAEMPKWMRDIIAGLLNENGSFGYCHSKGVLETREFLADKTNALNGTQITAEDILFFNGLGDAISKLYQFLLPTSRIIGPSPAYSTHSSAEAAHANTTPLTYKLDPENHWYPDMDDLYLQIKYNPNIVGILIINPDNPTGMVYPTEILERFVEIAKEFNLFLVSDEIYSNVTYNGAKAHMLAEYIDDVPGIALKGISKEFPWPGSRCGWMEYYNRKNDIQFDALCQTLDNAKMIEVCSTKLPQMAIPRIMSDKRYLPYREEANKAIGRRAEIIANLLGDLPQLTFNKTYGAFYNTIIFKKGVLKEGQKLQINNPEVAEMLSTWIEEDMPLDKRFVYYLLASKGVCVVPISSFCSELQGFRVTLLEENEELLEETFTHIREAVLEYCN